MFLPKYTITEKILKSIKKITVLIHKLNDKNLPKTVLVKLQEKAEAVSTYASTSIEGNPLPLTEVRQILKNKPESIRDSEREVLNYNNILKEINRKLSKRKLKISLDLILYIHRKITDKLILESQCGFLRTEPVFVNDPRSRKTIYWPPDQQDVFKLTNELVEFVNSNRDKIDPLIISGIFHKQMVITHPFMDGNGRTTRLATKILLSSMGLDTFNLFSFENYYNNNVTKYFERVGVKGNYYDIFQNIDFTSWLEYFTDGILDELLRVEKDFLTHIINPRTELKEYHQKIISLISKKGYTSDRIYAKSVKRAKATRRLDFNKLIGLGLIERRGKGKNTYYVTRKNSKD